MKQQFQNMFGNPFPRQSNFALADIHERRKFGESKNIKNHVNVRKIAFIKKRQNYLSFSTSKIRAQIKRSLQIFLLKEHYRNKRRNAIFLKNKNKQRKKNVLSFETKELRRNLLKNKIQRELIARNKRVRAENKVLLKRNFVGEKERKIGKIDKTCRTKRKKTILKKKVTNLIPFFCNTDKEISKQKFSFRKLKVERTETIIKKEEKTEKVIKKEKSTCANNMQNRTKKITEFPPFFCNTEKEALEWRASFRRQREERDTIIKKEETSCSEEHAGSNSTKRDLPETKHDSIIKEEREANSEETVANIGNRQLSNLQMLSNTELEKIDIDALTKWIGRMSISKKTKIAESDRFD
ncbi:hypothetical protein MHBO_003470 [Bonamia ostreae]|uniref:Uncharacterized protein n=1 Tax=Bonamia ostreae TaxID=126728 RepID=A0ABV2AR43_9EUKA